MIEAPTAHCRFEDLPTAQQADLLCNDDQYQRFAAIRCGIPGQQFCTRAAAQYLRECCQIDSRRQLNTERRARNQFQALRTDFDMWRGRIARPR